MSKVVKGFLFDIEIDENIDAEIMAKNITTFIESIGGKVLSHPDFIVCADLTKEYGVIREREENKPETTIYTCEDCYGEFESTFTCAVCGCEICFDCAYTLNDGIIECPTCYNE